MNRLTKRDTEGAYDFTYSNGEFVRGICPLGEHPNQEIYVTGLNKLGKLEDLEQELGCPLEVIFKAKKQKHIFVDKAYCCGAGEVYDLTLRKNPIKVFCDLSVEFTQVDEVDDYFEEFANRWCFQFQYNIDNDDYNWDWYLVSLKDYGKTWWLKSEREEN